MKSKTRMTLEPKLGEYLIRFESYCKTQEQREEEHNGITCTIFVVIHKKILLSIEWNFIGPRCTIKSLIIGFQNELWWSHWHCNGNKRTYTVIVLHVILLLGWNKIANLLLYLGKYSKYFKWTKQVSTNSNHKWNIWKLFMQPKNNTIIDVMIEK